MSRKMLLGSGAFALLLLVGWWSLWPQRPRSAAASAADPIKIVRSARHGEDEQQSNKPVASGAAVGNPSSFVRDKAVHVPEDEEMRASMPDPTFDPETLYRRIRTEDRNKEWAERSEAHVRAALGNVPYIDRGAGLRVSCASTLCEIRGSISADTSLENSNVAIQALQGNAFARLLAAGDLDVMTASFGNKGKAATYTIYTKRR